MLVTLAIAAAILVSPAWERARKPRRQRAGAA
jgi:hypothetical protein